MGAQVEANGVSSERPQILSTALVDLFVLNIFEEFLEFHIF